MFIFLKILLTEFSWVKNLCINVINSLNVKGAQFGKKNTKSDHQETYIFMQEHGQSPARWP